MAIGPDSCGTGLKTATPANSARSFKLPQKCVIVHIPFQSPKLSVMRQIFFMREHNAGVFGMRCCHLQCGDRTNNSLPAFIGVMVIAARRGYCVLACHEANEKHGTYRDAKSLAHSVRERRRMNRMAEQRRRDALKVSLKVCARYCALSLEVRNKARHYHPLPFVVVCLSKFERAAPFYSCQLWCASSWS